MLEPNEAVAMWLALDAVDEQNGCVRYVPGSHKKGVQPHACTQTLGFSQSITDYGPDDAGKEVAIRAEPDDRIVHHSVTVHGEDANPSARQRRVLGFKYHSQRARVDERPFREYKRQLDTDLAG